MKFLYTIFIFKTTESDDYYHFIDLNMTKLVAFSKAYRNTMYNKIQVFAFKQGQLKTVIYGNAKLNLST